MKAIKIGQNGVKNGTGQKGKYSNVYKVMMKEKKDGDMNVAVKEYMLPSGKEDEDKRELVENAVQNFLDDFENTLINLDHPNLARYYGVEYLPGMANGNLDRLMLTTDWVDHTPLKGPMEEDKVRDIIAGAMRGLEALHKSGFCHEDVRPCNILVTNFWRRRQPNEPYDKLYAILTDYALFKKIQEIIDPQGGDFTTKQSPNYLAPEVFSDGKDYDTYKVDIWSMAATALYLLSGNEPWSELGRGVIMHKVLMSRNPPKYPEGLSPACKAFLDSCFDRDYRARPTATEALASEWLKAAN